MCMLFVRLCRALPIVNAGYQVGRHSVWTQYVSSSALSNSVMLPKRRRAERPQPTKRLLASFVLRAKFTAAACFL